jgi:hypothetical protein
MSILSFGWTRQNDFSCSFISYFTFLVIKVLRISVVKIFPVPLKSVEIHGYRSFSAPRPSAEVSPCRLLNLLASSNSISMLLPISSLRSDSVKSITVS